jgi:hypothetical protein
MVIFCFDSRRSRVRRPSGNRHRRLAAAGILLGLAACDAALPESEEDAACAVERPEWGHGGDLMLPGTDCLSCHQAGGHAADSPFTVAGTVFRDATCAEPVSGALVHVVDGDGLALALETNEAGNFFTDEALVMPVEISVEHGGGVLRKPMAAGLGSCNACHVPEGAGWVRPAGAGETP